MCLWRVSAEANTELVKSNLKPARDSAGDSLQNVSANVPPRQLRWRASVLVWKVIKRRTLFCAVFLFICSTSIDLHVSIYVASRFLKLFFINTLLKYDPACVAIKTFCFFRAILDSAQELDERDSDSQNFLHPSCHTWNLLLVLNPAASPTTITGGSCCMLKEPEEEPIALQTLASRK